MLTHAVGWLDDTMIEPSGCEHALSPNRVTVPEQKSPVGAAHEHWHSEPSSKKRRRVGHPGGHGTSPPLSIHTENPSSGRYAQISFIVGQRALTGRDRLEPAGARETACLTSLDLRRVRGEHRAQSSCPQRRRHLDRGSRGQGAGSMAGTVPARGHGERGDRAGRGAARLIGPEFLGGATPGGRSGAGTGSTGDVGRGVDVLTHLHPPRARPRWATPSCTPMHAAEGVDWAEGSGFTRPPR
jgi:hypothetical protein